ncbi:MAG: (Fe-S)-binding protein [Candidatus Poribacteria bacterium]|nr:(Fe-S)-binding protein [Candidatus Poribacteria bacterium]
MMTASKRVALCVTCLVDQVLPEVGVATVKLLRRAGYAVDFPEAQTCCGQPFFNSGFRPEAIDLAKRTVEIFEGYEAVVLPSGSCTTMIRVEYPHLLEAWPQWHRRAEKLAAKTYELSQFLTHQAQWKPKAVSPAPELTYHDSCHMCRTLQLQEEPRQLLEGAGCRVNEMTESNRCCGFGGLFSIRMPEVSNAMTAEKLRQAVDTGADMLVTADPGCLMQMRGLASGSSVRVEHLATVLEEATR